MKEVNRDTFYMLVNGYRADHWDVWCNSSGEYWAERPATMKRIGVRSEGKDSIRYFIG